MRTAKILFVLASVLVIGGGILHFVGQFGGKEEGRAVVIEQMKSYKIPPQTGKYSLWDVMQAFGVGLGAYIIWYGILNLVLAGYLAERPAVLRNAALLNAGASLTFVVMAFSYRILPPGVVSSPHLILYVLAAIFAQRQLAMAKRSQG